MRKRRPPEHVVEDAVGAIGPIARPVPTAEPAVEDAVEANGSIASPIRAAEIAAMQESGLREFIELTGIDAGNYGIFRIAREGVTLHGSDDSAAQDLAPQDQVALLKAEEQLGSLVFPCLPERFLEWYDATRGETGEHGEIGVSDFPLPAQSLRCLRSTARLPDVRKDAGRWARSTHRRRCVVVSGVC
jgi:hypothetical protein